MKNIPKEIYLDLGFKADENDDFENCDQVTWSKDNATGNGIRYVHESQLKEMYEKLFNAGYVWKKIF